ncbi:hypothetical protein FHS83_000876 [Rhizomicrobium palustre]|uniref:DUF4175 domain-containing protein n=1 Tax=Rhizomicrobium palustre TaxID=189966 RepID=A0A846MVI3_9PROT|nr:hypothetical protein [Rhizomicrobium palustre]NIK87558.1 hypothetical protein [Rhizomicrobium palustre]
MGIVGILAGLGLFFVLLWNFAIYALPAAIGISAGWWSLNHGAGIGCIAVGMVAGVAVFVAGRAALMSHNLILRWLVIALFVIPATWAGYGIVMELTGTGVIPSPIWRHVFAIAGAIVVAGTAAARLMGPVDRSQSA